MQRHFTVTGFVSADGKTALHWHKFGMWLPPGGHIEADEDPVQATLREVLEETGLEVELVPSEAPFRYQSPPQLPPPATIGVFEIPSDGSLKELHEHIDMVYFTRPRSLALPETDGWRWVDAATLRDNVALTPPSGGDPVSIADDVRELGLAAIAAVGGPPIRPGC